MTRIWTLTAAAAAAGAFAAAPAQARAELTPEAARGAVITVDDPLEVEVVLSTEKVAPSTRGLFRSRFNDGHLRARLHKGTGAARFEVRQSFNYAGAWRGYDQVNYETESLPRTAALRLIETNRDHCQMWEAGMECVEVAAFEVEETELRRLVESSEGEARAWRLKFKSKLGRELRAELPRAEIVGLLRAVDEHRAAQGLGARTAQLAADGEAVR